MRLVGGILVMAAAGLPWLIVASQTTPAPNKTTVAARQWAAVQTISKAHCNSCHTGQTAAAGLDLTKPAGWTKFAKPGQTILLQRIHGQGGKPRMPLGFAPLSPEKMKAVEDWVAGGAQIAELPEKHWAYQPIVRPKVPVVAGVTNPIDAFVRTKLKAKGLAPNPPAAPSVFTRRLSLDITGLPNIKGDVDELLNSPHYGERQAQFWMDLARYADSDGYEKDLNRPHAWRYRDWVIDAFNRNLPFDRFTTEQLAGDLLPNSTLEQKVATGFHRNTMANREGGIDPADAMYKVILDRVNTTSTVWLGSSMACAQCHDHKYDPFTQRDYYRMFAVFNRPKYVKNGSIQTSNENWDEPSIKAPSNRVVGSVPMAMVLEEDKTKALRAPIHFRGEFLSPRETVPSGTPHFLPKPDGTSVDRLEMSKWLTDRRNPLTARVQVNRMWAQVFGRGIVETAEDFGTQGSKPSHPELLDWLAMELMDSEWDLKHIWKLIYSSQTYRQSSEVPAAKFAKDPGNVWLSRGPRFRLDAEAIRDQALAVSGLLSPKVGGPSVMPPQPDGVWQTPYNGEAWTESKGEDRYRRGLYTFMKRSSPYPAFTTFDSTSRETCLVRRSRTNTPLQSLAMMNDVVYSEAAAALAKQMAAVGNETQGVTLGFSKCTGRTPTQPEMERLLKLLGVKKDWNTVAVVLLNLDETVTKS